MNRRRFVQTSLLGATFAAIAGNQSLKGCAFCKKPGDPTAGLKLGVASYSLRNFTLDQAIEMTRQLDVRYITLKDMHLSLKSTPEEFASARKKLQDAGLVLMGGGVIYMNSEAEVRNAFAYAKNAGMPTIVGSPDPALLKLVEQQVKDTDIRLAIHNHGPGDLRFPSPFDVWEAVKNLDGRIGLCIDVGHTVRIGVDPVEAIRKCSARLHDFHIKDVTAAEPKGETLAVGRGIVDIVAVLKALKAVRFSGHLALEYEATADNPMPGMIESFAYMKGVMATMG